MKKLLLIILLVALVISVQAQDKQYINPFSTKPPGYTHVVVVNGPGKTIYISGQVPTNAAGEIVGKGDLKQQVLQVYENLQIALKAAGATFADVVKMNTYVVNYKPADVTIIREVRALYLPKENPPASTLAGVQALYHPDVMIEIEAIAVIK
ncbi:MAG TPA: RidA family protein [Cyclobacteriaceae bacterium]|nr:RidA family protein [Cyclobacteriaceae bacterium]